MKPSMKIIILIFVPLLSAFFTYLLLSTLFLSPYDSNSTEKKLVIVSTNILETAKKLEEEKIIKHWWGFYSIFKLRSLKNSYTTGEYEFSPSMSPLEIVKKINNGIVKLRKIIISPSDNLFQIIEKISDEGIDSKENLEQKVFNKNFIKSLGVPSGNLEGYLFPATYEFSLPITGDEFLKMILDNSNKHWSPPYDQQAKFFKMDRRQILTLASIIEGECIELKLTRDLQTLRSISAVYHNRLKRNLPLNASSTIYYFNKNASHPLTEENKKQLSPFNTFINIGLPPSPIGNPSYDAIKAALYPVSEKFISFSVDEKTHGLILEKETIVINQK